MQPGYDAIVKAQFLILSGPHRGRTVTSSRGSVLLGSDPTTEVCVGDGPQVKPIHAKVTWDPDACAFHLVRIDGHVFVNRTEIEEVILSENDLVEIGIHGPQLRFRTAAEEGDFCKPVHRMLQDAKDVRQMTGSVQAAGVALFKDLFTRATWQLKVFFPIGVAAAVFAVSLAAGWMGSHIDDSTEREVANLREQGRKMAEDLEKQRLATAAALDRVTRDLEAQSAAASRAASAGDLERLREEFAKRAAAIDDMMKSDAALKHVLEEDAKSVALIHGSVGFKSSGGVWLKDRDGDRIELEYTGSAFVVAADGTLVTNRHVAQPWWKNDSAEAAIAAGCTPQWLRLAAVFPGKKPIDIDPTTIRLRQDDIDVAVLNVKAEGLVPLTLSTVDPKTLRGSRIVVLGYPTGVKALLAKAEQEVAEAVTATAESLEDVLRGLAERGAVHPLATQGALNEVGVSKLVFDADTTSGGSGGPIFGPDGSVIGVAFAIVRDFGGSNLGVPIRFAKELLSKP